MFESARIKLTIWYVIIALTISTTFNGIVFAVVSREMERGFAQITSRLNPENYHIIFPQNINPQINTLTPKEKKEFIQHLFAKDLTKAKRHLFFTLLYINAFIGVVSAGAGYFLSKKTLEPIEKAMEDQKRFIADASHELKTPITSLITLSEVALRNKKLNTKEAKETLKENLEEAGRLKMLVNSLLALARSQKKTGNLENTCFGATGAINTSIKNLSPLIKEKSLKIKVKSRRVKIFGHRESIEKLITILLDNAIKYSPNKSLITISAKRKKGCTHLIIKDTGGGISKKDLPHIFERFYRSENTRFKNKSDGFGLGLSVAKEIITKHKGKISVKSKLGKGTTFEIKLPFKQ